MASAVMARYEYSDGGSVTITVQVEASYPDALDECAMPGYPWIA